MPCDGGIAGCAAGCSPGHVACIAASFWGLVSRRRHVVCGGLVVLGTWDLPSRDGSASGTVVLVPGRGLSDGRRLVRETHNWNPQGPESFRSRPRSPGKKASGKP